MKHPALTTAKPSRSSVVLETLEGRRHLSSTVTITTDRAQTIDGFGTSLGGQTSVSLLRTKKFQQAYYRDLGASMFRAVLNPWVLRGDTVNGKKSMGAPVYLGPNVNANIKLFNWYDSNIQKYGLMARAAVKYGDDVKLIGSFWSPPYWMKGEEVSPSSGTPNGVMPTYNDGSGNTSGGSLIDTDENLTQFGRYIATYVAGFQKMFGVKLDAISLQNELAFHQSYSSAVYSPELYVKAVKAVKRWFTEFGLDTRLMGPEDVGVGATNNTGILNRQMKYIKALRADKDALNAVDLYAVHGYADDGINDMRSPEMWSRYWNGYDGGSDWNSFAGIKVDNKPSWMTEMSGYSGTWNSTLRLASTVQDQLVHGNVSAFVYWGITNTTVNGEALMQGADYSAGKYNALKHFSKYVRPGAVRLETSDTAEHDGVYVSAFADDTHKTLTSVLVNNSTERETVTLRLDGISLARFGTAFVSVEGKTWRAVDGLRVKNGRVTFEMPARSIMTLAGATAAARRAAPTGTVSGVYFLDGNKNGRQDKAERGLGGDKVFLDLNANGTRDTREPVAVTNKNGAFAFAGLPNGTYRVRREVVNGWMITTPPTASKLVKARQNISGVAIGVASTKTSTGGGTTAKGASIIGRAFADTNGNGRQDASDPAAVGKTVFLDSDNDGKLDAGETKTTTDASGNFAFTGLNAGTYYVRRLFSTGYEASTTTTAIKLTENAKKTGVLIGSREK